MDSGRKLWVGMLNLLVLHIFMVPSLQMENRRAPYDLFDLFVNTDRGGFTGAILADGSLLHAAREGQILKDDDCDDHVELFLYGYKQYLQNCQCLSTKIFNGATSTRHNQTELRFDLGSNVDRMIIARSYLAIPHSGNQLVCEIPSSSLHISCSDQEIMYARRGLVLVEGQPLHRTPSGCPTYSLFQFGSMVSKVHNGELIIQMKCTMDSESCQSAWEHRSYLAFLQLSKGCFHPGCPASN